jgi:hypothetical protein
LIIIYKQAKALVDLLVYVFRLTVSLSVIGRKQLDLRL